ncbi:hypothetical protein ACLOJK_009046 [Asimina triloba]
MAIKELEKGGSSCCNDENCNSSLLEEEEEEEEEDIRKRQSRSSSRKWCGRNLEPCAHGYVGAINKMDNAQPMWFCTKQLTYSDVRTSQNCLLFPKVDTERLLGLLMRRERSELQMAGAGSKGIRAAVVDEMGRRWNTRLNVWASKSYNLNGDWR